MEIDVYIYGVNVDPQSMMIDLIVVSESIDARTHLAEFLRSTVVDTPDSYKYDIKLVFTEKK